MLSVQRAQHSEKRENRGKREGETISVVNSLSFSVAGRPAYMPSFRLTNGLPTYSVYVRTYVRAPSLS